MKNNVEDMIKLRELNKINKELIFNKTAVPELLCKLTHNSKNVARLGKAKVWKPTKYRPSRSVLLANSQEELGNLYKIDE